MPSLISIQNKIYLAAQLVKLCDSGIRDYSYHMHLFLMDINDDLQAQIEQERKVYDIEE